jgi:hypothetical protein
MIGFTGHHHHLSESWNLRVKDMGATSDKLGVIDGIQMHFSLYVLLHLISKHFIEPWGKCGRTSGSVGSTQHAFAILHKVVTHSANFYN